MDSGQEGEGRGGGGMDCGGRPLLHGPPAPPLRAWTWLRSGPGPAGPVARQEPPTRLYILICLRNSQAVN